MSPRFSVIIPAYNEARLLPRLIESIIIAATRYDRDEVEIIVADNMSTDDTKTIAESMGCTRVTVEKRRIAAARNGGARAATGEVLCFIDADSALHPDTFIKIAEAVSSERFIVAATGVYLERRSLGLVLTYLLMFPLLYILQMDTGVVFCRREDFNAVGGYNEDLFFAEDVAFLYALKQHGAKRGQGFFRLSGVKALGSTRKFDENGDWHYFPLLLKSTMILLKNGFRVFVKQDKMPDITDYWYQPPR